MDGEGGPSEGEADPDKQCKFGGDCYPEGAHDKDEPDEHGGECGDFGGARVVVGGGHLIGFESGATSEVDLELFERSGRDGDIGADTVEGVGQPILLRKLRTLVHADQKQMIRGVFLIFNVIVTQFGRVGGCE